MFDRSQARPAQGADVIARAVGALALAALAVSMSWTCRPLAGWPSRRWAVTC